MAGPHQRRDFCLEAVGLSSASKAEQNLNRPRVNKKPGRAEPLRAIFQWISTVLWKKKPRLRRQLEAERL